MGEENGKMGEEEEEGDTPQYSCCNTLVYNTSATVLLNGKSNFKSLHKAGIALFPGSPPDGCKRRKAGWGLGTRLTRQYLSCM